MQASHHNHKAPSAQRFVRVAIALGSNVGDRRAHLEYAVARLAEILTDIRVSTSRETDPVGVGPQPKFLNAVAVGATALGVTELMDRLLAIERDRGRQRLFAGAPRTLDLDLVLYGDAVVAEAGVTVPHLRFRERRFVLEPLAEVAPGWIDPVTGRTVAELLERLDLPHH